MDEDVSTHDLGIAILRFSLCLLSVGFAMKIKQLEIRRFRGIEDMTLVFDDHTVVIGPNGSGKTTIINALGLMLGRDRLIRDLTEHDFFGCDPQPTDRLEVIVTFTGFDGNDTNRHPAWFREGRGMPKWWNEETQTISARPKSDSQELCLQLAYAGRFDQDTLTVESRRYFYDDASIGDAFDEEGITDLPFRLLREVGFFLVPSQRT